MTGITKEKSVEQATPFFTRIYKNHKTMIKDLLEGTDAKSSAEVVRRAIELAHKNFKKNKK